MSGTKQRIITGLIFGAIVIGGMLAHQRSFQVVFILIAALCLWEFFGMTLENQAKTWAVYRKILGTGLGLLPILVAIGFIPEIIVLYTFAASVFIILIIELFAQAQQPFNNIGHILLGIIYIGFPFALVIMMSIDRQLRDFTPYIILGILLMVWASDVAAYFSGRTLGKNKLFPRISPKKTWEGAIGGLLGAVAASALIYMVYKQLGVHSLTIQNWLALGAITAVFGILGDLVESMLKRSVNIKDSGNLLPGHGGFLDRFDAFIFVIPFAYLYLNLSI